METILVTGGTGFLGSYLTKVLVASEYNVVILKRSTSDTWRIDHLMEKIKWYDIDQQDLAIAFEEQRIDAVLHMASLYGRRGEALHRIVESNLLFGIKVLDACLKHNVQLFINTDTFFNTSGRLQEHLLAYTLSKKQFVEWLRHHSQAIRVVNLRLQHIYGPKDNLTKFIPWVVGKLREEASEIDLTPGDQLRDFIFVHDVVSAYLTVLRKAESLEAFTEFDVGTGQTITLRDFLSSLKIAYRELSGSCDTRLNFGAIPYGQGEIMTVEVDNSGLKALGWEPTYSLSTGLAAILK